jgi:hypothetical protein
LDREGNRSSIEQVEPLVLPSTNPEFPDQDTNGSSGISPQGNESLNGPDGDQDTQNQGDLRGSIAQDNGSGAIHQEGMNNQKNETKPPHAEQELIIRFVT